VLAYDFDASKPEGISLFEETGQVSLSLDETWLVMEPMGIATPFVRIVTGGMVSDPVIGVQAAWRGQPALFEISLNVDETGRGGYTFRVEPRDSVFQIVENGTVLTSSGFDVSFFAGTHQITFSAEGTALIVEVDGNIHLEATVQEVLPPGPTGLHVDARNPDGKVSINWLFICGR
jgi:hypothetical protein